MTMFAELPLQASDELRGVIDAMVKIEDTRLSSDDATLVMTDFRSDRIHVFGLRWEQREDGGRIPVVETGCSFTSDTIVGPHGIALVGNEHVVVTNRHAGLDVYRLPVLESAYREHHLEPLDRISGDGGLHARVKTPGSAAVLPLGGDRYDVIVGNNRWHFLSTHRLELGGAPGFADHRVVFNGPPLRHPEGISFSPDGALLAVSNDVSGETSIFDTAALRAGGSGPVASLVGSVCPHTSQFLPDGRMIAADAASPYLFVYEPGSAGWSGTRRPEFAVRVMTDDQFFDGRLNSRDGGTKGMVLDSTGQVLFTSRQPDSLRVHDVADLLAEPVEVDEALLGSLLRERDAQLQRAHSAMLAKTWDLRSRAELTLHETIRKHRPTPRARVNRRQKEALLASLSEQNHQSTPLVADGGPAVSLTTFGPRMETAFYAIEAMAAGDLRPGRVVLWLSESDAESVPSSLRRLEKRGLEIRTAPDTKAYKKYLPYVLGEDVSQPLVTADDDALYDQRWLADLVDANRKNPAVAHCHRAKRMAVFEGRLLPYEEWGMCSDTVPSHLNFVTGVSGAIYPPALLERLRDTGYEFLELAPHNDDVWINANALRAGVEVAQLAPQDRNYKSTPESQSEGLASMNVIGGWNQIQLRRVYGPADVAVLVQADEHARAQHTEAASVA